MYELYDSVKAKFAVKPTAWIWIIINNKSVIRVFFLISISKI